MSYKFVDSRVVAAKRKHAPPAGRWTGDASLPTYMFKEGDRVRATSNAIVAYLLDPSICGHGALIDGVVGTVTLNYSGLFDGVKVRWDDDKGEFFYGEDELELVEP